MTGPVLCIITGVIIPVTLSVAIDANTAPIILALATLVTAIAAAVVLLFNALRQKRIETKVDAGAVVQGEIHTAVNGTRTAALQEIAALKLEIVGLKDEIVRLRGQLAG